MIMPSMSFSLRVTACLGTYVYSVSIRPAHVIVGTQVQRAVLDGDCLHAALYIRDDKKRDTLMDSFKWERGGTPLSSRSALAAGVVAYLLSIGFLKSIVRNPIHVPTWIAAAHNLVLCVGSLIMFIGTAYESLQVYNVIPCTQSSHLCRAVILGHPQNGFSFAQSSVINYVSMSATKTAGSHYEGSCGDLRGASGALHKLTFASYHRYRKNVPL
jgi:hypothetical protein